MKLKIKQKIKLKLIKLFTFDDLLKREIRISWSVVDVNQ